MRSCVAVVLGSVAVANAAPAAKLTFAEPTVTGAVAVKGVTKTVKAMSTKLLACYKKALAADATLGGDVSVSFTIEANGKVSGASAAGLDQTAETCIVATLAKAKFAKPSDRQPASVTYPLTFTPPAASNKTSGAFASLTATGDIPSGLDNSNVSGGLLDHEKREMVSGGGGTGWGTIGTGRYGTIGHGSGNDKGRTERTAAVPTVALGAIAVTGDLDKAIIGRYIKRNLQKLQYCYEKELVAKPTIEGTVTAVFTIGADGKVSDSKSTGDVDANAQKCVASVVQGIEFPKPKAGTVDVSIPLTFRPTGN